MLYNTSPASTQAAVACLASLVCYTNLRPIVQWSLVTVFVIYLYMEIGCKSISYIAGFFSPNYKLTIGVDFALKVIYWDEVTKINLQLWYVVLLYFQWELSNQRQTNDPGYKQIEHFK